MRSTPLFFRLALLLQVSCLLCAGEFTSAVVSVQDRDTITVLYREQTIRIRLNGIDCPERNQPSGTAAQRFTGDLALGKGVKVVEEDIDRYGRVVATVILPDGRNLNHEIVAAGWEWWYRKYAPEDSSLRRLESEARKNERGLWAEPAPIPPWEWRKQNHVGPRSDRRRSEPRSERRDQGRRRYRH